MNSEDMMLNFLRVSVCCILAHCTNSVGCPSNLYNKAITRSTSYSCTLQQTYLATEHLLWPALSFGTSCQLLCEPLDWIE